MFVIVTLHVYVYDIVVNADMITVWSSFLILHFEPSFKHKEYSVVASLLFRTV